MDLSIGLSSFLAAGVGLCGAALLFLFWANRNAGPTVRARELLQEASDQVAFIFDDDMLVDATPLAREFLSKADRRLSDFEQLATLLSARFPEFRDRCKTLVEDGKLTLSAADDQGGQIELEHWYGLSRIILVPRPDEANTKGEILAEAMSAELDVLRGLSENAPILIWRHEADGTLSWANRAFVDVADQITGQGAAWPPPPLFGNLAKPAGNAPVVEQAWLDSNGQIPPRCYEVTSVVRDAGTLHFAVDVTEIKEAEKARQQFVQTLSKTFAQLSVGLAVFDRSRRLVTFNPALIDILQLPTDFLIARPSLPTFLDRLRERRMLPEPKDFNHWREEIEALETGTSDVQYEQNWDLPNGLTFRVTGRPHPDGALAFLFEDVSDELALTRRFRSQIDLNHDVLDALPEAIAVFSSSGLLQLSNRAYRELWQTEGHLTLHGARLEEEVSGWAAQLNDGGAIEEWARKGGAAPEMTLADGRAISGGRHLLAQGAVMFRFRQRRGTARRLTLTAEAQAG